MALSQWTLPTPARPSWAGRSPTITIRRIVIVGSPTADRVYDLDVITFIDGVAGKGAPGDQFLVDLHGDAASLQFQGLHQVIDGGALADFPGLAVEQYLHQARVLTDANLGDITLNSKAEFRSMRELFAEALV